MKTIIVQNNIVNAPQIKMVVTNKQYKDFKQLQHSGGFKRFNMELYDEHKGGKNEQEKIVSFLGTVFTKRK
jgi:hypothetical protein